MDRQISLDMYRELRRIRLVEDAIARRYGEDEMRCPTHLCIGQEAPPVGVSAHLRREDLVFSAHRSHGHYLAKGGDLKAMLAEIYGRATGCASGKGGSQHLIDLACGFMGSAPILASTISVGVGAAWAITMNREDRVAVVYFGDGATEEGAFHEAMNFASVKKLPVIFVCENNLYSVHSAMEVRQPERPVAALALAHGMPGHTADGNKVEDVYALAGNAINRARVGGGPSLLEFETYRWMEHCGPNEDLGLNYRSPAEFAAWKERDPVVAYRNLLVERRELSEAQIRDIDDDIMQEIEDAFSFAKASPFPAPSELTTHIYPPEARRA